MTFFQVSNRTSSPAFSIPGFSPLQNLPVRLTPFIVLFDCLADIGKVRFVTFFDDINA